MITISDEYRTRLCQAYRAHLFGSPYLDKVTSQTKRAEIADILDHPNPTHYERLWLVGFLKFAGYSYEEVLKIIAEHCQWDNYNPRITAYQVATVFKQPHRMSSGTGKRRPRKWDLSPLERARIIASRSMEIHRKLAQWLTEHNLPVYGGAL